MSGDSIDWAAQDWEDLIPRLLLLAVMRLSRPASHGGRQGATAGSSDAQDVVDEAVAKTLSGRRAWDSDAGTLFEHLAGVVASDISDAARSADSGLTAATPSRGPLEQGGGSGDSEQAEAWRSERRRLLDHLYDKDEKLGEMASLILLEDCRDIGELASALEVVPLEIANMRRRMKREVRAYIAERGT